VSDPWAEEGFGGDDEWEGGESLEADLEEDALSGVDELDDAGLDDEGEDTLADEEP
jgi:hypothetical protein